MKRLLTAAIIAMTMTTLAYADEALDKQIEAYILSANGAAAARECAKGIAATGKGRSCNPFYKWFGGDDHARLLALIDEIDPNKDWYKRGELASNLSEIIDTAKVYGVLVERAQKEIAVIMATPEHAGNSAHEHLQYQQQPNGDFAAQIQQRGYEAQQEKYMRRQTQALESIADTQRNLYQGATQSWIRR